MRHRNCFIRLGLHLHRASLKRAHLPTAVTFGKDDEDFVLTGQLAAVIHPGGRIAGGEHRGIAKHSNVSLLARDVLDLQIAGSNVADELRFVVAFKRIGKVKVLGHYAIKRGRIGAHHCFDPFVVHLTKMQFDLDDGSMCWLSRAFHHATGRGIAKLDGFYVNLRR
jgi:hypothetical protein